MSEYMTEFVSDTFKQNSLQVMKERLLETHKHKEEILDLKIAHAEEVKNLAISFMNNVFRNTEVKKNVFETKTTPVRETYSTSYTDTNYDPNTGQQINTTTWSPLQETYRDVTTSSTTTTTTEES